MSKYIIEVAQILDEMRQSVEVIEDMLRQGHMSMDKFEQLIATTGVVGVPVKIKYQKERNIFHIIDAKQGSVIGYMFPETGHGYLSRISIRLLGDSYHTDWYDRRDTHKFIGEILKWLQEMCLNVAEFTYII